MRIRAAFEQAAEALTAHPQLLVVALGLSLLKLAGGLLAITHPLLYIPGVVISLFGSPYIVAGFYGLVAAALTNQSVSLSTFLTTANNRYARLFIGRAGVGLLELCTVGTALLIVAHFGETSVPSQLPAQRTAALYTLPLEMLGGLTGELVGLLIISLIPLFILQFFSVFAVVDDTPLLAAYARSARLVRQHLAPVCAYTTVRTSLVVGLSLPAGLFRSVATVAILTNSLAPVQVPEALPLPMMSGVTVGLILGFALVLGMLGEALIQTFHIAYVRQLEDG